MLDAKCCLSITARAERYCAGLGAIFPVRLHLVEASLLLIL